MNRRKEGQRGFNIAIVFACLVGVLLLSFIIWRVWDANVTSKVSETQTTIRDHDQQTNPEGYIEYSDPKGKFKFLYPKGWKVEEPNMKGTITAFVRPSLSEVKDSSHPYDGPSFSLVVSRWDGINDIVADEEYQGKRQYATLMDYLNDENVPSKKIGEITVNGVRGFEVLNPGINTQYAIMFEQTDGIYQLEFMDVAKKENLSDEDKAIIDSFNFK